MHRTINYKITQAYPDRNAITSEKAFWKETCVLGKRNICILNEKPIFTLSISGKRILDHCIFSITIEITDCSIEKNLLMCTKGNCP